MDCPCESYDEAYVIDDLVGVCECGHNDDEHDDNGVCGAADVAQEER